jgi:hypothetical protein
MQIKALKDERSPVLIATFLGGYAFRWRFAVPESYKEALDIRYTPDVWTQGRQFNFTQGSILYDTPLAYELEWGQALEHIKLFVQVSEASPPLEDIYQTIQIRAGLTEGNVEVSGKSLPATVETRKQIIEEGITVNKTRRTSGKMRFKVFRPTPDLSGVEEVCTIACSQDEFVIFLQTGLIRGADNNPHDLFTELDQFRPQSSRMAEIED